MCIYIQMLYVYLPSKVRNTLPISPTHTHIDTTYNIYIVYDICYRSIN